MKTAEQVRDAITVLTTARHFPCDCAARGQPHVEECRQGGLMVDAVLDALKWSIDDESNFDGMIEGLKKIQAGENPDALCD